MTARFWNVHLRVLIGASGGILLIGGTATAALSQSGAGWTSEMKMTVDSGAGAPPVLMSMRMQRVPGKLRMEASMPGLAGTKMEGAYNLMNLADSTITSVIPGMRMASVGSMAPIIGTNMPHMTSGAQHLTRDSLEDLGDGEPLLDHPTHHYRETKVGTLDVAIGEQMCVKHFNNVTDEWLSSDPEMTAMMASSRSWIGDSPLGALAPDFSSSTSKFPEGVPLRMVVKSTTGSRGGLRTVTTTIDFAELTHGEIADSLFTVPTGYNTMDMRKMMAEKPAGMMESAMKAALDKDAANEMKEMCDSGGR